MKALIVGAGPGGLTAAINLAGLGFEVVHQLPAYALALHALVYSHHPHLALAGGGGVQAAHGQGSAVGVREQGVMYCRVGIVGQLLRAGGLLPGLAQHGVAQGVIRRPGGGRGGRANGPGVWQAGWQGNGRVGLHPAKMHRYLCGPVRPLRALPLVSFTRCPRLLWPRSISSAKLTRKPSKTP